MRYFLPEYEITVEADSLEEAIRQAEQDQKAEKKKSKKSNSPS
jgi:hypothetical protein